MWLASMVSTFSCRSPSFDEIFSTTCNPKSQTQLLARQELIFPCNPLIPVIARASWNEWILMSPLYTILMNSSWMFSTTSLFTSSVLSSYHLVRIMKYETRKVWSNLTPVCIRTPSMQRCEEDDKLCPVAHCLWPADSLPLQVSKATTFRSVNWLLHP